MRTTAAIAIQQPAVKYNQTRFAPNTYVMAKAIEVATATLGKLRTKKMDSTPRKPAPTQSDLPSGVAACQCWSAGNVFGRKLNKRSPAETSGPKDNSARSAMLALVIIGITFCMRANA